MQLIKDQIMKTNTVSLCFGGVDNHQTEKSDDCAHRMELQVTSFE